MLFAYSNGVVLGLSLILAIGSQNAFVLRQGILRQHVWQVVLFCSIADAALIVSGVAGLSLLIPDLVGQIAPWLFAGAAIWLFCYGVLRVRDAFGHNALIIEDNSAASLGTTLGVAVVLTFGNPHVYLDTVVLIGTISLKYSGVDKLAFAAGAATASLMFFTALGYGGSLMSGVMLQPQVWRILNGVIAVVIFFLAVAMLRAGGWY